MKLGVKKSFITSGQRFDNVFVFSKLNLRPYTTNLFSEIDLSSYVVSFNLFLRK